MKRIVLLRHSKSSWRYEGLADEYRPLNERGYSEAQTLSAQLKRSGFKADRVVASPSVRTYSTALILAKNSKVKLTDIHLDDRLYETGLKEHLEVIRSQPEAVIGLVIVGHNDTISRIATWLSGSDTVMLPTSGYALLESSADSWKRIKKGSCRLVSIPTHESP